MAKYTPSSLLGELSGKLGSQVYSHNRGGPYVRDLGVVDQPGTARQVEVWTQFTDVSAACAALFADPVDALRWDAFGAQVQRRDALGRRYPLTGEQAYFSLNMRRAQFGLAPSSDPPTSIEVPYVEFRSIDFDTGLLDLTIDCDLPSMPPNIRFEIQASHWRDPQQDSFANPIRLIAASDVNPTGADNYYPNYDAVFPGPAPDGQVIQFKLTVLNAEYWPGQVWNFLATVVS